jgi:hypothetical protein
MELKGEWFAQAKGLQKDTRSKAMHLSSRVTLLAFILIAASPAGFSQLRKESEYSQDRVNTDHTYFVLHDTGAADFGWASEWTMYSSIDYAEKPALFIWYFKDGSKAYSQQMEDMGRAGQDLGYLVTSKSSNLEDIHRKPIQPMTRSNYPEKLELWIGEAGDTGFSPKILIDAACFHAQSIEANRTYFFSSCNK